MTDRRGGLMVFVKSHIPLRKVTDFKIPSNEQIIAFEKNFRKDKLLVGSLYKTSSQNNKYYFFIQQICQNFT